MKEFPEWKIALAEGVKNVKTCGSGKKARVQNTDKGTGVETLNVIKQNMRLIPPGSYDKITGIAYNCKDFTIHFGSKDKASTFVRSMEDIKVEYGDYVNKRGEYAPEKREESGDSDSPDGNGAITIVIIIFAAAIAYYLWKQAK